MKRVAATLLTSGLACASAWAQTDLEGSGDPEGIDRYPGSWIVEYSPSTAMRSYEFVTGKVARIRREVRIEQSERVKADLLRVTYRTPDGTRFDDAIAHYEDVIAELGARVDFTCRGLDCGLSTIWANLVFGVKELAAPDASQFYVAASDVGGSRLISIYVAQRPNRRVYAHVDVAETESVGAGLAAGDVVEALESKGFALLMGVTPGGDGELDGDALAVLDEVAGALAGFDGGTIYAVCHIGGVDGDRALQQASACAEAAAARLQAGGIEATGFGAGAMLPREQAPSARLELVVLGAKQSP